MLMLSLSTSGPIASAAVIKDGQVLSREVGGHGRTHSETITPLCEKALQTAGYTPADMDAFGVDAGPGSFTGVRIGICAANAMAAAFGKPVAAASSLEGLLYGIDNACALLDCRNGNGYATSYTLPVGCAEAREAGFVDADGNPLPLEKHIDPQQHTITFKLQKN